MSTEIVKPELTLTQNQIDNITLYRTSRNNGVGGYEVMTPNHDYSIMWITADEFDEQVNNMWMKVTKTQFDEEENKRYSNKQIFNRLMSDYNRSFIEIRNQLLEDTATYSFKKYESKPSKYNYNLENMDDLQRFVNDMKAYEESQKKRETMLSEVKTQNNISVNASDAISFGNTLFVNHVFYGADGFVYHPVQLHNETDINEIIMLMLTNDFVPLEFVSVPFDFALTAILNTTTISIESYYRKDIMISFENMKIQFYNDNRFSEEITYKLYFKFSQFDYGGLESQNIDNLMNVLELAKEYKNSFDAQFTGLNWELLNR